MPDVMTIFDRLILPNTGNLSPDHARYVLTLSLTEAEKSRCEELSYELQSQPLSSEERQELDLLMTANAFMTALKAKARRSLRPHPSAA